MQHIVSKTLLIPGVVFLFGFTADLRAGPDPTICGTELLADRYAGVLKSLPANAAADLAKSANPARKGIGVGDIETFWSIDVSANQPFQLRAKLRKIGVHCYIYVEDGVEMADATVERLARQFDEVIYPTDRGWFGSEKSPGIDGDARITLLFLDIQDGWEPGRGYVAGYYFPLDGVSQRLFPQSNEREMVYLDTHPANPARDDYLGILAHEFQHMIHNNQDARETRWLNEAFAQVAFYVCGYGHAPQTFQYVHNTDVNITDFKNTLENYGSAYLWTYYLYLHYAGSSVDEKRKFFRQVAASKESGMDSIAKVLETRGVARDLLSIFVDWAVANTAGDPSLAGGIYGYDDSLVFGVNNSAHTYGFQAPPAQTVKDEVQRWSADYIHVVDGVSWSPLNPTMIDKVTIGSGAAGSLEWTINGNQVPPQRLVPEGSTVDNARGVVVTPLTTAENGGFDAVIGPFVRLGTAIRSLNYTLRDAGGNAVETRAVPIFTIDSLTQPNPAGDAIAGLTALADEEPVDMTAEPRTPNTWRFSFQGARKGLIGGAKKFAVRAVVKRGGQTEVHEVALDAKNRGSIEIAAGADLTRMSFVVVGTEGKKLTYAYDIEAPVAPATADRQLRFRELHANKLGLLVPSTVSPVTIPLDGDEDTSRDNLHYVFNKNQELFHALTHLQIDPQLLEGQILKMWRLLEIARGFPHLPLPDGFAFVDFDLTASKDLVRGWAQAFGIDVPGLTDGTAGAASTADPVVVKEASKRLLLAHSIIEHGYNNGLILAQDFSVTTVYFVKFIFGVKNTIEMIADGLSGIPIVGTIAKKAKKLIISKLLKAVNNFSWVIASRMSPPYSSLVPIVVQIVTGIVGRSLEVPPDSNEFLGYTKEFIVGLAGKYVLTSLPKVGYVARGQVAVDRAQELTTGLSFEGSYADAYKRVWDDGAVYEHGSVRERIDAQITRRHNRAMSNQQIAWVTGKLGQVARVGAILDPTSITKVIAIALEVVTAGLFVHSGYTTASYFFRLPRGDVLEGVDLAFGPRPQAAGSSRATHGLTMTRAPRSGAVAAMTGDVQDAFATYLAAVQDELESARDTVQAFDRVVEADEALDAILDRAEAHLFGSQLPDDGSPRAKSAGEALESFYQVSQACHLRRAALVADLVVRRAGGEGKVALASVYRPTFDRYVEALGSSLEAVARMEQVPVIVHVSGVRLTHRDDAIEVAATVTNESDRDLADLTVRLVTSLEVEATDGASRTLALPAGASRRVTFTMPVAGAARTGYDSVTLLVEAEGVRGLSRMIHLGE